MESREVNRPHRNDEKVMLEELVGCTHHKFDEINQNRNDYAGKEGSDH